LYRTTAKLLLDSSCIQRALRYVIRLTDWRTRGLRSQARHSHCCRSLDFQRLVIVRHPRRCSKLRLYGSYASNKNSASRSGLILRTPGGHAGLCRLREAERSQLANPWVLWLLRTRRPGLLAGCGIHRLESPKNARIHPRHSDG
jgi:hypothetical protein